MGTYFCWVFLERSLNRGTVVTAPLPGCELCAFPPEDQTAQSLLGGVFEANEQGDVLINEARFNARRKDRSKTEWQSFKGEIAEMAANSMPLVGGGAEDRLKKLRREFDVFDK